MTGMSDQPTSDLLPLYETPRAFDVAMRGYDRAQVDRDIERTFHPRLWHISPRSPAKG